MKFTYRPEGNIPPKKKPEEPPLKNSEEQPPQFPPLGEEEVFKKTEEPSPVSNKQETISPVKEYTSADIIVASSITSDGIRSVTKDREGLMARDNTRFWDDAMYAAKEKKGPMAVNDIEVNGEKSLDIYFPSYDTIRPGMSSGYTGLKIIIPEGIEVSRFKDSFIRELSEKFYSLDLFNSKENLSKILEQVKELAAFAKQLFADKINQSNKEQPNGSLAKFPEIENKEPPLSPEENIYKNTNYFISFNETRKEKDALEKKKRELKTEEEKSFWKRDKTIVAQLKIEIKSKEQALAKREEFLNKQEAFLVSHPSVNLDGKTPEEAADLLLKDPQLVHHVWGTVKGIYIQKIVSGSKEYRVMDQPFGYTLYPYSDFRAHSNQGALYEDRRKNYTEVEAVPARFTKPEGKGFGIVWPSYDMGGNRPGYMSFWTIVSKYDIKVQQYLLQNPEVLLKIFLKEFKEEAKNNIQGEYADKLKLVSKEFIDVNS